MWFRWNKKLTSKLKSISKIIKPKKASSPLPETGLFVVEGSELTIMVTNTETWAAIRMPLKEPAKEDGRECLNVWELLQALKSFPEPEIRCTSARAYLNPDFYLEIKQSELWKGGAEEPNIRAYVEQVETEKGDFYKLLHYTEHAVSLDSSRPNLYGIELNQRAGYLIARATDGHRAARASCVSIGNDAALQKVMIPGDQVPLIREMVEGQQVHIRHVNDYLEFYWGDSYILTKALKDGSIPDFKQVIPEFASPIFVSNEDVAKVLKTLMPLTNKINPCVEISWNEQDAQTLLFSTEKLKQRVPIRRKSDEVKNFKITFNPCYLKDVFDLEVKEEVALQFGTQWTALGIFLENATFLIMPMRE
jgi:DNA polymerase III sliding clamp (beta) subunit (PCNA family)